MEDAVNTVQYYREDDVKDRKILCRIGKMLRRIGKMLRRIGKMPYRVGKMRCTLYSSIMKML